MTEKELAARVVTWLQEQGLDVYQEVQVRRYGPVADIVADVGGRGWVIEVKRSLGLQVLGQAHRWLRCASTRVSVAIPYATKSSASRKFAYQVCGRFGIGIIEVGGPSGTWQAVRPTFWRLKGCLAKDIIESCVYEHRTHCPAGSTAGHWTPFQQTMNAARRFLLAHDGWHAIGEIVRGIETHYRTDQIARSCLVKWLRSEPGEKRGIVWRQCGKRLEFGMEAETQ